MLSEQQYREVVAEFCQQTPWNEKDGSGASWNNDFILRLAMHGLNLLPVGLEDGQQTSPPFSHYIVAPAPAHEKEGYRAWPVSYIVDCDYKDHLKEQVRFTFTPLKKI